MAVNVYEEIKNALTTVKNILDQGTNTIKPAVQALAGAVPEVNDLLGKLVTLLDKLKVAVNDLDAGAIGGHIQTVLNLVNASKALIEKAREALPEAEKPIATTALEVATVISSLPSFDQLKAEIVALIDAVKTSIQSLRA